MKKVARIKTVTVPKLFIPKKDPSQEWFVTFSYLHPETGKFKRFRVYEGFYQCKTNEERLAHGKRLVELLKDKLLNGWNPFNQAGLYRLVEISPSDFENSLTHQLKQVLESRKAELRPKTFSDYTAALNGFLDWLKRKDLERLLVMEFTREHARQFFDYLQLELKREYKTCDKYLTVLKMLFVRLHEESLCLYNPFDRIRLGQGKHSSEGKLAFDEGQRNALRELLSLEAPQLWLFVQFIFYTFVRPKELRFVKVGDLQGNKLLIRGSNSKNRKTEYVTIPPKLVQAMGKAGLKNYPAHYYLFGKEGKPSDMHWSTNHFYRQHQPFLQRLGLGNQYSLYSWKHTGVVVAYQNGMDVHNIMRQCRHADLQQTTHYLRSLGQMESAFASADFIEL